MTDETKKIRDEMIAEAWMHAALKTSEFSSNSEQQDRKIFTLGFDAGYSARAADYAALKDEAEKLVKVMETIEKRGAGYHLSLSAVNFRLDCDSKDAREALTAWRENGENK